MRPLIIAFFFFAFQSLVFAQKSYVIEFDKISEKTSYFEKIKGTDHLKPVKAIFPSKGDHVQVLVKNVNPFVYNLNIEVNEENNFTENSEDNSKMLGLLGTVAFGMDASSIISNIPMNNIGRGESYSSENQKIIGENHGQLMKIINQYERTQSTYSDLLQILKSESSPVDSIKIKSLEIINDLEELTQNDSKRNLFQIIGALNEIEPADEEETKLIEDELKLTAKISSISTLKKNEIENIKNLVLNCKSTVSKKHTVGYGKNETSEYKSSSDEPVTDLVFKLSLTSNTNNDQNQELTNYKFNQRDYVEYFNLNRWKDQNGEISDAYCHGCTPILLATGYIQPGNLIPEDYKSLFDGSSNSAYGLWKIYDDNEKIISSFVVRSDIEYEEDNPEENEPVYTEIIRIKCQESNLPKWSSGVFLTNPFSGRSQFSIEQSAFADSLIIIQEKSNSLIPSIGATACFEPLTSNPIRLSYNVGISMNTFSNIDENKINILGGIGVSHGNWKYLSISAGTCLSRTTELKSKYQIDSWYNNNSNYYNKLINTDDIGAITQDVFKLGYYIGFHFNF